jgi:hypothetical protein
LRLMTAMAGNGSRVRGAGAWLGGVTMRAPATGPVCSAAQRQVVMQPALWAMRMAGSSEALMAVCRAATRSSAT